MKPLTIFGFALSAALIAAYAYGFRERPDQISEMTPNEWGDFLAGAAAPLALLWLVLGYFQQSKELALNTEALRAQQEELKNQVEETKLLVQNAGRQAEAFEKQAQLTEQEVARQRANERNAAQPIFYPSGKRKTGNQLTTTLVNKGGVAIRAQIVKESETDIRLKFPQRWENEQQVELAHVWSATIKYPVRFNIEYWDKFDERHMKHFYYEESGSIAEFDPD